MSGGSFDYLFSKDPEVLFGYRNELTRMVEYLGSLELSCDLPEQRATAETKEVIQKMDDFVAGVQKHIDSLKALWRAVEWEASNDSSPDQTIATLNEYYEQPSWKPELTPLNNEQLMRVGAMIPEMDRNASIRDHLEEQRRLYKRYDTNHLIEELIRRDENALKLGHEAADGRLQGRFLREVLRTVLSAADHGTLRNALSDRSGKTLDNNSKAGTVENLLRALGAEPADNRLLKLHGSTLGTMDTRSPEEAIQDPLVPTQGQDRVADNVREFRREHVAERTDARRDETAPDDNPKQ